MAIDENDTAQEELDGEMKKLGLTPAAKSKEKEGDESDAEESDDESKDDEEEETETEDESKAKKPDGESEDEEESDESDEDESEDEEDEDKEESSAKKPKKYIPKDQYDRRKANWIARENELLGTISKLEEAKDELQKKVPNEVSPKLAAVAKEIGIDDPKNLQKVLEAFREELKGEYGDKVPKEVQERLDKMEESVGSITESKRRANDEAYFSESWSKVQSQFDELFPSATAEQKDAAKGLLDKIWHTKEWHDKDADYVLFKNKAKFAEIISPRKKGLETGRSQGATESKGKLNKLPSNPSEANIRAMDKRLADEVSGSDSLKDSTRAAI